MEPAQPVSAPMAGSSRKSRTEHSPGFSVTAAGRTDWLATTAFADLVSGNSSKPLDVVTGKETFVCLPLKARKHARVGRCIIGALLNAAYEANGAVNGRILFLLDEVFGSAGMDIIRSPAMPGANTASPCSFSTSSADIVQWGEAGKRAWYEAHRGGAMRRSRTRTAEELSNNRQLRCVRLVGGAEHANPWPAAGRTLPLAG